MPCLFSTKAIMSRHNVLSFVAIVIFSALLILALPFIYPSERVLWCCLHLSIMTEMCPVKIILSKLSFLCNRNLNCPYINVFICYFYFLFFFICFCFFLQNIVNIYIDIYMLVLICGDAVQHTLPSCSTDII